MIGRSRSYNFKKKYIYILIEYELFKYKHICNLHTISTRLNLSESAKKKHVLALNYDYMTSTEAEPVLPGLRVIQALLYVPGMFFFSP